MIELVITGCLMFVVIATYILDTKRDWIVLFCLCVLGLFLASSTLGGNFPKYSEKIIIPKIKVVCENNKCDTTYIYE